VVVKLSSRCCRDSDIASNLHPLQLKAIVDLKERKAKGEVLEATQLKKIEGETAILQELKTLESSLKK
jgi:uncharacterized protein with WD repeat